MKKWLKNLGIGTLAATLAVGAYANYKGVDSKELFGGTLNATVIENNKEINVPVKVLPFSKLHPFMCAKFARLTAEDNEYHINPNHAWEFYKNNFHTDHYDQRLLRPFDIVVFYKGSSSYQEKLTKEKNYEGCHAATYLGLDKNKEKVFAEQNGFDTRIITLNKLIEDGTVPTRIIGSHKIGETKRPGYHRD